MFAKFATAVLYFFACIYRSSLINNGVRGVKLVDSYICLLLFADDVLLFGNSPEDLQHSLNTLSWYCANLNLSVNLSKSKVLVFNAKNVSNHVFRFSPVEIRRDYKYLGLLFDSNSLSTKAPLTLAGQENKALFSLLRKAHYLSYPDPDLMCHLFDSMVLPTLVYGSELGPQSVFCY